jgi:uncharacterized protein YdaU (DUF1376 family)
MHYYQFNIGDYASHTKHLSPIEDICYRRALDYYYLHEQPLTSDIAKLSRLLMLNDYQNELMTVLNEFFVCITEGYINPRADKEIKQYQEFSNAGKRGAAKRWSKGGDSPPITPSTGGVSNPNANHKPITIKHKTRISDNFEVSDYVKDWAIKNKYDLRMIERHKNYFITACKAQSYEKESWDDFFIKAIVDNWLGSSNPKGGLSL